MIRDSNVGLNPGSFSIYFFIIIKKKKNLNIIGLAMIIKHREIPG